MIPLSDYSPSCFATTDNNGDHVFPVVDKVLFFKETKETIFSSLVCKWDRIIIIAHVVRLFIWRHLRWFFIIAKTLYLRYYVRAFSPTSLNEYMREKKGIVEETQPNIWIKKLTATLSLNRKTHALQVPGNILFMLLLHYQVNLHLGFQPPCRLCQRRRRRTVS